MFLRVVGNKSALYPDKLRVLRRREGVHVCLLWIGAHLTVGKHGLDDIVSVQSGCYGFLFRRGLYLKLRFWLSLKLSPQFPDCCRVEKGLSILCRLTVLVVGHVEI